jgi:hypothetical protein
MFRMKRLVSGRFLLLLVFIVSIQLISSAPIPNPRPEEVISGSDAGEAGSIGGSISGASDDGDDDSWGGNLPYISSSAGSGAGAGASHTTKADEVTGWFFGTSLYPIVARHNSDYHSRILLLILPLHDYNMLQTVRDGHLCLTMPIVRYDLVLR